MPLQGGGAEEEEGGGIDLAESEGQTKGIGGKQSLDADVSDAAGEV